jgi:SAM-dependent methyltransferase
MKLQLAASRFDKLSPEALRYFLHPGWIHLGDAPGKKASMGKARELLRDYGLLNFLRICWTVLRRKLSAARAAPADPAAKVEVEPFYYRKGDSLAFEDGQFDFVYTEHFFEHLFLDEALALLRETRRVLAVGGVVRIAVPDADLRTDLPPEPAGFPYAKMPFTHPEKHKTRWSVYSLAEVLRLAGLRPLPLRYHDLDGVRHDHAPTALRAEYPAELKEQEFVLTLGYLQRPHSLVVDGIRDD